MVEEVMLLANNLEIDNLQNKCHGKIFGPTVFYHEQGYQLHGRRVHVVGQHFNSTEDTGGVSQLCCIKTSSITTTV